MAGQVELLDRLRPDLTDVVRHAATLVVVLGNIDLARDGVLAGVETPVVAGCEVTTMARKIGLAPGIYGGLAPLKPERLAWG